VIFARGLRSEAAWNFQSRCSVEPVVKRAGTFLAATVLATVMTGCLGGSTSGGGVSASSAHVASPAKLRVLRESFVQPRWFHRASSIAEASRQLPIAIVRPHAPLASDRSIASVWISNADMWRHQHIVLIWRSGVVETIDRWRCNCEAAPSLKEMGHRKPFRFLMLRGAPAITAPSATGPSAAVVIGLESRAQAAYGRPASVETIREGYNITLWQYGAHTQPGLIAAARTLPVAHIAFQVDGYEAAGAVLGDRNGAEGIDVAPRGGARFGIGVALQNVTGQPLTVTGVRAINGFIHLIGIHLRAYTPPVGSVHPLIVRRPYDTTPGRLDYVLQPHAWVGMQLHFRVRDPCVHWAQGIYDRTVEVSYTQGSRAVHIQEVPTVPLNITSHHNC
jgi:hypothetical protein